MKLTMKLFSIATVRTTAIGALLFGNVLFVPVQAQSVAPPPAAADPQNASVVVPATVYRSAFEGYRMFATEKVAPWRDTNETVGRIGGWRVYSREAQQGTDATSGGAPAPVARPVDAPAANQAKPTPHKH